MPRTIYINGESMVQTLFPAGSTISGISQLGLTVDAIEVVLQVHSEPILVDAYGKGNPIDEQVFGGEATIMMNLVDFNPTALAECVRLSFPVFGGAGTTAEGALGRAGARRGGGAATAAGAGSSYIGLNITSPVAGLPYNFPAAYLRDEPYRFPLGTERSIVRLTWRALAYQLDPWGGGTGSLGAILYNRTALVGADAP